MLSRTRAEIHNIIIKLRCQCCIHIVLCYWILCGSVRNETVYKVANVTMLMSENKSDPL